MPRCRRVLVLPFALAGLLVAGCGDDDEGSASSVGAGGDATTSTSTAAETTTSLTEDEVAALPPLDSFGEDDAEALREVYGPPLEALDLTITRGGVVQFRGGNHLQLYAEPTTPAEANSPQVFLDRMIPSFRALLPLLFDAYPELDSFDLCQEPVPDPDAPPTEPGYEEPVTLLLLTRAGYEAIDDWETVTLEQVLAVAGPEIDDLGYSQVAPDVAALPDYQAAVG